MSQQSPSEATSEVPSIEQTMRALSDDRRRATLSYLFDREVESAVSVEELARQISEDDDTERVYRSLHHAHLPQLDDAGIVTYERGDERVSLAGDQSSVEDMLAAARKME